MIWWRPPSRGTRQLKSTGNWTASQYVFDLLAPHVGSYLWPIRADNDQDRIRW